MLNYLCLFAAIVAEVIATTALAQSDGFTRLAPSLTAIVGYVAAFWMLAFPLRTMPTGVVYAIWAGFGIVLIALVAVEAAAGSAGGLRARPDHIGRRHHQRLLENHQPLTLIRRHSAASD